MARLSQLFAPKEREFFDLFEEAGANLVRAAEILEQMLDKWPDHGELARDVVVCEQEGDRITHDIIQRLNSTFVTPIDREDIYAVDRRDERRVEALDDVVRDPVALLLADDDVTRQLAVIGPLVEHLLQDLR